MSEFIRSEISKLAYLKEQLSESIKVQKAVKTHRCNITAWCGADSISAGYCSPILPPEFAQQVIDQHVENLRREVQCIEAAIKAAEEKLKSFVPSNFTYIS